jgi:hypothetical protein
VLLFQYSQVCSTMVTEVERLAGACTDRERLRSIEVARTQFIEQVRASRTFFYADYSQSPLFLRPFSGILSVRVSVQKTPFLFVCGQKCFFSLLSKCTKYTYLENA